MPKDLKRGVISFKDVRDSEHEKDQMIDIVQLKDTYKAQPRDNVGVFIHMTPDGRLHADVYPSTIELGHLTVKITASLTFSGSIPSGTSLPMTSGQTFGFGGNVVGASGCFGMITGHISGPSLALSSNDAVYGTMLIGSALD